MYSKNSQNKERRNKKQMFENKKSKCKSSETARRKYKAWFAQECEKVINQKNFSMAAWINNKEEQDRNDYIINEKEIGQIEYLRRKRMNAWIKN